MGATMDFVEGDTHLRGRVPSPIGSSGLGMHIETRVLRASDGEWVTVATFGAGEFDYAITEAGAYRVEVWTNGAHFAPQLDTLQQFGARDVPWMMTNAWRVGL